MEVYLTGFMMALKGAPVTIGVSLIAVIVGAILGLGLASMRRSSHKIFGIIATAYVEIVRGTPLVVQALILAFGVPVLLQQNDIAFRWADLIIPGIVVCGLNSAAYMAEVIRGGIQAVDQGQIEAAQSLGMSKGQVNRLIVLPQALRIVAPSLGNEFVSLIKETAVLSYCGISEILRRAALYSAASFEMFAAYVGAAAVYLMITYPLSKGVQALERYLAKEGE